MTQASKAGHLASHQDLADTPLGPVDEWPQSLRTAVATMMASGHAMCLVWGPERVFLYNNAYAPMLGERHPGAFGARFEDVWLDVWVDIAPLVEATFRGETSTFEDMLLTMTRNGHAEETWWTFSYSPVRDERGNVAGLLNVTLETTSRVLAERERDEAIERLRRNEAKWRRLFETLEEGFILATVIRDDDGQIVDWRYEEVNKAWYELVGVEHGEAEGRTIRELFPEIEDEWVRGLAGVVDSAESVRFTRQVGSVGRWYDGIAQAVDGDRFTVIFSEVTDRVLRERRQAAIIELSDALQQERTADRMPQIAAGILRRSLDVGLVGFGDVDASAETVMVQHDQTAPQTQMFAKTLSFRKFGSFVDDLKTGQSVAVSDVRTDPRTRDHADALETRDILSFVSTPVLERGKFVALLYVTYDKPKAWHEEELQFAREVAYRLRSAIERVRALEQEELLNGELSHRIKNTLSVVQAIATQSQKAKADTAAVQEFSDRLKALSSAHDVLLTRSWAAADLKDVAEAALASFASNQVLVAGPPLRIGSRTAMSLSLLLHELATNAVKYGALSVPEGQVTLRWSLNAADDGDVLAMTWSERGGPSAVEPTRRGFGSRIIRMGLTGSGGVQQSFGSEGLTVEMTAPLHQVQQG